MIPNMWYAILESNEVKRGKLFGVTRMGEKMVLWRDSQGKVTCMSDLCPHRGVALSVGKLVGDCIQCPFHGFEYNASGRCRIIPAIGKNQTPPKAFQVQTYPTREEHDLIYIWWGEPREVYPPVPFFDTIHEDKLSYATLRDHWTTHYSRAIENQLDMVHLPFVHHNTIGRGNKTLVNGPGIRLDEKEGHHDQMNLWINNAIDVGQKPLKPDEIDISKRNPLLQFRFPNLWHNWLGDNLHVFISFAPIDNENTMMYIRMYQNTVRLPILRDLFNYFGMLGNLIIERQDRRVVVTQKPKRSELRMGEKLIQGDGPIIEYRRRRQVLIDNQNRYLA